MLMFICALCSGAFGLFMAWTLWGDRAFTPKESLLPPWQHYLLTVGVAIGSVSTVVTAVGALL